MLQSLENILIDNFIVDNLGWPMLNTGDDFISGPPIPSRVAGKGKESYGFCFDSKTVAVFKFSISVMVP